MKLSRTTARAPVRKQLLAASFDEYHRNHVVPQFVRYDGIILALMGAVVMLAVAVVYLLVRSVA